METVRLPRFQRASGIAPMQLTERDRDIIRHVHRHRFLRSSHIVALAGGSAQQTLRRLQLLFHHGYLERPRAQIDYYHRLGSRPLAYGIGSKGASLLRRERAASSGDWQAKNRAVERVFLEHALLTSDVMVAVELACRRGRARLLSGEELQIHQRGPVQWRVHVANQKVGVIPDRVFGLESEDGCRSFYFLEADRGTMPVTRRNTAQSSYYRKLLAYQQSWQQGLLRKHFGGTRFRVLTVTSTAQRQENLLRCCRGLPGGKGLFLFTHHAALIAAPDMLTTNWLNAEGTLETLT